MSFFFNTCIKIDLNTFIYCITEQIQYDGFTL